MATITTQPQHTEITHLDLNIAHQPSQFRAQPCARLMRLRWMESSGVSEYRIEPNSVFEEPLPKASKA